MEQRAKHIQAVYDWLEPVAALAEAGQPKLALDKLDFLTNRAEVLPEDRWIVLWHRALCYHDIDQKKYLACLLETVKSTEGQPLFTQKKLYSAFLFGLYEADLPDEEIRQYSFAFDDLNRQAAWYAHERAAHARHRKIRVGYIASRFDENVLSLFIIRMLCGYDRSRFEVYCYAYEAREDRVTEQVRANVRSYYVAPHGKHTPPDLVAARIYEDGIDILFELMEHTESSLGLLAAAFKPAPVQLTGIGFMGTSGLRAVDYFLGDPYCDPPGLNEQDFSEKLLRLPRSHFCYTPSARALEVGRKYRPKGEGEEILLASFCNVRKLTPRMLGVWAGILRRLPRARLLLRSSWQCSSYMLRRLREAFQRQGVEPDRLLMEGPAPDYLERYLDVDLLLDTYPYVGGGTTCDALYMGVPVISLYGRRHGTRFGYSLLMNTGLGELAAATEDEYMEKVVALAQDPGLLAELHEQIPKLFRRSPVMDAVGYMEDIQMAYEEIWQRWLAGH